jgi:hypothetical protein
MQNKSIFFIFLNVLKNESTSFKIVKICLMIKIKLLASKCLHYNFILQPIFQSNQHFYEKRQIREAQKQKDPTDPDPEHCIEDKPGKYKMSQRLLGRPLVPHRPVIK